MSGKFILRIILITIIVFLISNLVIIHNITKEAELQFVRIGEQFTSHTSDALSLWAEDQLRLANQIAKDKRIIDMCLDPENAEKIWSAENFLKEVNENYDYYENLPIAVKTDKTLYRIINNKSIPIQKGTFLVDTAGGSTIGKGGLSYSYIRKVFQGQPCYFSEIYPSIFRGNPIMVISVPVKYNHEIIGIALVSPKMDYFTKVFVDQMKLGKTGYLFFLDNTGTVIAHSNRDLILSKDPDIYKKSEYIINQISKGNTVFKANLMDESKYYYGKKVAIGGSHTASNYYIVFAQSVREVNDEVYNFSKVLIISAILSSVLLITSYLLFSMTNQKEQQKIQLISANKNLEEVVEKRTQDLRTLAATDGLTKLFNHQHSLGLLSKIIKYSKVNQRSLVVMLADLDFFKKINDVYGHQVGDDVLKNISLIFKKSLRDEDIAGRYGGEEFIFILPDATLEDGKIVGERIRKNVENYDSKIKVVCQMWWCTIEKNEIQYNIFINEMVF